MDVLKEVESARKVLRNQQIKADESTLLEVREASVRQKDMADIGSLDANAKDLFDKAQLSYENWSSGKADTASYLSAADDIAKSARKLSNVINRIPLYYNTDESREYIDTMRSNLSQLISNAYSANLTLKKDGQIAYNTFADLSAAKQQYEEYVSNEEKYQEYKYAMQEREEALEYYQKQTYEMLTEEQWRGRAQDLMFLSKYPTYQDYIDAYRKGEVQAEAERRQAIATEYDKKLSAVTNEGKYKADWYGRYNYEKLFEQYGNSPDYDINVEEGKKLSSNTDVGFIREEFQNMYYYLLNTQGEVEADNYLANFEGYINYFKGLARAEELKDGSVFSHALTDVQAGLSGFWRGVKAFAFPGEYLPNSSSTYAYGINREERSWIGRLAGDVFVNIAQNAPSWLLARIPGVGAALGYGSFFATAAGNAYITAQELGVDTEQATAYSLIIGASETTLEKLLSGLNYSGGLIGEQLFKDSAIQFSSTWAQAAFNVATSKFAKEVVGEFTEEYLQEILEPVFRNICFDENNEFKFFTVDAAYAGLIGALSAATHYENIQQLRKDTQYTAYAVKAGAEFQKYENVNALVENAIQLGGEVAEYARSLGDNPTAYQIGELVLKSGQQRTEIGLVNQLFDSIGYKVNVVDTLTPDGQTEIVNGHISKGKKEVTLARDANHLLSWVAKHEFVHSLENTPQYAQLRDFIVNSDHVAHILEDSGRTYDDAINGYAKVLSEAQGTEYTFEDAEKEFLGDYVAKYLFNNESYVNELVNAYRPLSSKLLASVSRLKRAAFGSKLERYFTKAERTIMKARDKVETVEAGTTADSIRTNKTQESITSFFDALGIDVSPIGKFGISTSSEVTVDVVKNSKLGKVLDYALKKGNISSDDYDKQIRFIVELGEMIRKSPNPRMLWEFVGSNAFSSITSNSDPQYISTIDFGTVCVKTQELINKMSKAMIEKAKKNNGFGALTKEEIFALYDEAGKQGYQTPCPQCYVFERWVGLGSRLNEITLYQQRYGNLNYDECLDLVKRVDGWLDIAEEIVGSEKKFDNNSTKKAKLIQFFEREGRQEDADLIKAYSWLTGTRVNRKSNKGKVTYSEYKSNKGGFEIVPVNILYDYNSGDAFAKKYPLSWKYRTSGGSAYGKAIQPYTDERIGEIARGVANTDDVVAKNDKKFTYDDARAMKSAERNVRSQNLRGGQRMNSTSDFMYAHGLDYLLALMELQALGSNVQLYTKVTESVPMLCAAGADMNISLMPEGRGYVENGDGTRSLLLSSIQGVNYKTAQDLANRFVNAQLIMVGINDIAIKLALSGDAITFVIPYHASGGEAAFVTALMNSLGEAQTSKDFIYDYTNMQSDTLLTDYKSKYSNLSDEEIDGLKARHERLRKIRQGIISGKAIVNGKRNSTSKENSFALTPDDLALIYDESQHGRPYIEQLLIRFYGVDSILQEVESEDKGVVMTGKSAEQIFPYEYWDTTSTIETADINSVRFVEYCESMGIVPRFSGIDSSGKKVTKRVGKDKVTYGNFAYEEQEDGTVRPTKGYWKLLIDRPMYNIAYKNGQRIENFGSYRNQQKINVTNLKTDMFVPEFDPQDARMSKRYFVQANTEGADLGNFYDVMTTFHGLMDAESKAGIKKIDPDDPYQLINEISAGKQVLEQNSVGRGFFVENGYASMTDDRIDGLIEDSSAGNRTDYAQKWITSISPKDFLEMTLKKESQDREAFDQRPGDYGETVNDGNYLTYLKSETRQTPYLMVDVKTGDVVGHEGRHRMRALEKAGVEKVDIAVEFYDDGRLVKELNGYGNELTTIPSLDIHNQYGTNQSTKIENIIPLNRANRENVFASYGSQDADLRYSTGGDFFQYLNEIAKETGAIPPGQGPRRNVVYPKRVPVNGKMQNVSRFNRSAAESPFISDETREENAYQVASGRGTYTPTSNAANMAAAELMRQDYVDDERSTGYEKAVNRVEYLVNEGNLPTASDIAFAELMIIEADNIGDYETAGRLIAQTAVLGTRLGQAVQALSLIKKLGNNGRLYVLEQEIKDINRSLTDGQRKKIGAVKLSEESRIKLLEAKGEKELDDAVLDATKEIYEQIPATWADKWNSWRYLAMLLNPVTHIRNMASNLAMIPNAVLKNSISRALKNTDRSVVLKDEYKKAAERIMRDSSFEKLISGNKYEDNKIRENRKVFNNKFLEWLRVKNSDALSLEDSIFKRFYFKRALAGYMQRHNISPDASVDSLQKGIEFAVKEANLNTFNAESKFANWLNKTSKKHWAANIAINGLIPFKRTPINILKQSLAYTPLGMTTIRRSMNRNEVVDTIASSFSGTAMMVIGALLYLNGSLTLKGGKGKDDKFDELQGSQDYSLRIGDRYFSINWLVPASVPMFLGAEFAKLITEWGDIDPQDVFDAVKRTATPVVELSMLQGLTNSVKSIAYSEDGAALIDLGSSMFTNYLSQAFPTIFGKINNTIFEDRTTTYADRNRYIPADIQRFLQRAAQRIPGAAKVLPKYLDNWGRTDTESNIGWRLLENFIFPGYVSTENTSDMEKELDRLYNETGKSEVLPGDNVKKRNLQVLLDDGTTEKKEVYFTADEYREYNILYKGLAYQSLTELTESDYYKNLSSNEKVTAIKAVWDACKDIADVDIMTTRGMNPYMAKSSQAYFSGIDPVTFSIVNTARDENGNLNMESRRKAMEDLNLNDVFRQVIWNLIYPDAATNYDGTKRYKK